MSRSFYPWPLDWNDYTAWCRSTGRRSDYKNQDDFYIGRERQMAVQWGFASVRDEVEKYWCKHGSPYYNVHPFLVPKLCSVNLASIPTHLIELPGEYKVVNIRLAEQHPEMTLQGNVELPANVPWAKNIETNLSNQWVHSILMLRPTQRMLEIVNVPVPPMRSPEEIVLFLFDFNVVSKDGIRTWAFAPILWRTEEDTLEDALEAEEFLTRQHSPAYVRMVGNAMRLAVTIGFMANSKDALIEPDVLSKDRFTYERGNESQRQAIVDRAMRRGKIGYNVGNDLLFLGHVPGYATKPHGEGEGRGLSWAHIRSGHPHAVRYGPKKSKVKIMWFRPTTVRDDLPFKPPKT